MKLTEDVLEQWRQDPSAFIESQLINPETNKPFALLAAEKDFLKHALRLTPEGVCFITSCYLALQRNQGRPGSLHCC